MKEMLVGFLGDVLGTVLLALLSLGTAYALSYIAQARDSLQQRTKSQLVDQAIARAAYLAEVAVLAAEGAAAAGIREAVAQGRASRDDLIAIGRRVADEVLERLGQEGRQVLEEAVGDVRRFVEDLIEAKLEELKAKGVVGRVRELSDPK